MTKKYSLDLVIDHVRYPARGEDVISECIVQRLPSEACRVFAKRLKDEEFNSPDDLHEWFSQNITSELAKKLGGNTVYDLISRNKKVS